jgi:hypothetical protein
MWRRVSRGQLGRRILKRRIKREQGMLRVRVRDAGGRPESACTLPAGVSAKQLEALVRCFFPAATVTAEAQDTADVAPALAAEPDPAPALVVADPKPAAPSAPSASSSAGSFATGVLATLRTLWHAWRPAEAVGAARRPEAAADAAAAELEADAVAAELEADAVAAELEADAVAAELEADAVAELVGADAVAAELVAADAVAAELEADAVAAELVAADAVAAELDGDAVSKLVAELVAELAAEPGTASVVEPGTASVAVHRSPFTVQMPAPAFQMPAGPDDAAALLVERFASAAWPAAYRPPSTAEEVTGDNARRNARAFHFYMNDADDMWDGASAWRDPGSAQDWLVFYGDRASGRRGSAAVPRECVATLVSAMLPVAAPASASAAPRTLQVRATLLPLPELFVEDVIELTGVLRALLRDNPVLLGGGPAGVRAALDAQLRLDALDAHMTCDRGLEASKAPRFALEELLQMQRILGGMRGAFSAAPVSVEALHTACAHARPSAGPLVLPPRVFSRMLHTLGVATSTSPTTSKLQAHVALEPTPPLQARPLPHNSIRSPPLIRGPVDEATSHQWAISSALFS